MLISQSQGIVDATVNPKKTVNKDGKKLMKIIEFRWLRNFDQRYTVQQIKNMAQYSTAIILVA